MGKPNAHVAIILSISAMLAVLTNFYTYENRYNGPPIRSDGLGYYLYLPAIFIHKDPYFTFLDEPQTKDVTRANYGILQGPAANFGLAGTERGYLNKYPIGTAVMQAPFFFVALE